MKKGKLKIEIFRKKLIFNITFSVTKRKLKNRESEKMDDFQFSIHI